MLTRYVEGTEGCVTEGHKFELAGLGKAPYAFKGISENRFVFPDGTSKAGGSCDFCGTGISTEFHLMSADGKRFKVGCNCIEASGQSGLRKLIEKSPEFLAMKRAKEDAKAADVAYGVQAYMFALQSTMSAMPHPRGFTDRTTGQPLTYWDYCVWMSQNCGRSGMASMLAGFRKKFGKMF